MLKVDIFFLFLSLNVPIVLKYFFYYTRLANQNDALKYML